MNKNYSSIIWALFLIMAGIVLLLNNLGIVPWNIWSIVWRFWPFFLILWGIQLILGKSLFSSIIIGIFALLSLLGIFLYSFFYVTGVSYPWTEQINKWFADSYAKVNSGYELGIEKELSSFDKVKFTFNQKTGEFNLTEKVLENAILKLDANFIEKSGEPKFEKKLKDSTYHINFDTFDDPVLFLSNFERKYNFSLAKTEFPYSIEVNQATGKGNMELISQKIDSLAFYLSTGEYRLKIGLDSIPKNTISLKVSTGDFKLLIPKNVGIKANYEISLGNLNIDGESSKLRGKGVFEPQSLGEFEKILSLEINISLGNVDIQYY